jgi:hypothetical protein
LGTSLNVKTPYPSLKRRYAPKETRAQNGSYSPEGILTSHSQISRNDKRGFQGVRRYVWMFGFEDVLESPGRVSEGGLRAERTTGMISLEMRAGRGMSWR